ncbi:MAG TPA: PfkB family carbohydrate kinase [Dermatophilaceae bacterium]|jgi:sugar/nucleoside kinase (ribokinase family)
MSSSISVIGNIQLDVLASPVSALPTPGGDTVVERIAVRTAGAAGNVSLALAALGVQHRLFGTVGDDDAGRWVISELERLGLEKDIRIVPGEATGISIALEAPERERSFLTAHGVLSTYGITDLPSDAWESDLVLLTGYFSLPGLRGEGSLKILQNAKTMGAQTFFDTGWDPEEWAGDAANEVLAMLPHVDVFLPNESEAFALTGETDAASAAAALTDHCRGWVVVKLGSRGLLATGPSGAQLTIDAPAVKAIDTTGAGDSLAAGLLASLADGHDVASALATGVRVASTVVGRDSHRRYPTRQELLSL